MKYLLQRKFWPDTYIKCLPFSLCLTCMKVDLNFCSNLHVSFVDFSSNLFCVLFKFNEGCKLQLDSLILYILLLFVCILSIFLFNAGLHAQLSCDTCYA